jgi:replicative DNA helicase
MTGPPETKGNREQEVSSISRSLKGIAKELNVPIIALSQLNRSVETRSGSKRPQLSDLRESGAIEQDADLVLFIHRPEKYGMDVDEEGNSMRGLAEILVAKHRNGAVGDVHLKFKEEFAKFSDLEEVEPIFDEDVDDGRLTLSSKMNKEDKKDDGFDLTGNTGFEEEPF